MERHGGTIEARSEGTDRGSAFTITLPAAAPADAQSLTAGDRPRRQARACRILVADDNPDAAEMLRLMLSLHGHEVIVARDGADAVERASAVQPQIAFLDIGMPRMDGYEAARHIRQALGSSIRLVALTAGARTRTRGVARAGFASTP